MRNALSTKVSSADAAIAHPTTRREKRSSTAARYNQPSYVQMAVMSPVHFSLGRVAVKSRSRPFGANRALGSLLVVMVRWRGRRATNSHSRMRRATRLRAHLIP